MQLLVFTAIAVCTMVVVFTLGLNGTVSGIVFLFILFIGIMVRVSEPIRARLRP